MKLIYNFKQGEAEGDKSMADVLGGKGANLAEMCRLDFPIPPGLTIPTEACAHFMEYEDAGSQQKQDALIHECVAGVEARMYWWEKDAGVPILVSVRSGARVSMPGMMNTVLNVGLTVDNIDEYRKVLGEKCALDSFRRLIQMYATVVYDIPSQFFEDILTEIKGCKYGQKEYPKTDADLSVTHLEKLIDRYLETFEMLVGSKFPTNLTDQLKDCIAAVFKSWNSPRAIQYRKINKIPDEWGTAVNVQQMVFGNSNDHSCSGVLFSRNPDTGEKELYGDWLPNAQGEDVVSGIRQTFKIESIMDWNMGVWYGLNELSQKLEEQYNDMQDVEFTVQDGKLWFLQTRGGHRAAPAAFKIAYDLVQEGKIDKATAVKRVSGKQYLVLNKPSIDKSFKVEPDLVGIPAAGLIVTGVAVFSAQDAMKCKEPCILVAKETTPDDFSGMVASVGILTSTGGATSHAAVVARGMDKTSALLRSLHQPPRHKGYNQTGCFFSL